MGALVDYLDLTQRGKLPLLRPPVREAAGGSMQIDAATRRNLELVQALSGGERQMCAVGRAMMSLPRLLMLDEPSLGLAPIMVDRLFDKVQSLVQSKGLSVLLVEQNVGNALRLCQRGCVLDHGHLVKVSTGAELLRDPDVQRTYMGV